MISVRSEVQVFPGPPIFAREASEDCPVEPEGRSLGGVATSYDWQARRSRGHSSVGRAPALQAGGRRFDPVWLHQSGECSSAKMNSLPFGVERRSRAGVLSDIVKRRSLRVFVRDASRGGYALPGVRVSQVVHDASLARCGSRGCLVG